MAAQARMDGKVCLITGATRGIGLETAKALGRLGATLVLVGRDTARTEDALAEVRAAAPGVQAEGLLADFNSLASVRALAEAFKARHARLDVLLNNAGLILDKRQLSAEGFESTLAINHLAPFLLTHLLREVLVASGPARIVTVSSDAHRRGRIDFEDLQAERGYSPMGVYSASKLANVLFTQALARRLSGTRVTANSLHPGVVSTGFALNTKGPIQLFFKLAAPLLLTAEQGARTSVYLASSPEVEGVSGQYFYKCRPVQPSRAARDEALAERLWQVSCALSGVKA